MLELRNKNRADYARAQAQAQENARRESITPERAKYVEAEAKRIAEEKAEKRRILALVKNDQIERSAKAARKLEQKKAALPTEKEEEKEKGPPPITVAFNEVAVTFRLLDGNTITARFMETSRLGSNVRKWVEQVRLTCCHQMVARYVADGARIGRTAPRSSFSWSHRIGNFRLSMRT